MNTYKARYKKECVVAFKHFDKNAMEFQVPP